LIRKRIGVRETPIGSGPKRIGVGETGIGSGATPIELAEPPIETGATLAERAAAIDAPRRDRACSRALRGLKRERQRADQSGEQAEPLGHSDLLISQLSTKAAL